MSNLDNKEFTDWLNKQITSFRADMKLAEADGNSDYAYAEGAYLAYKEVLKNFESIVPTPELPRRFMRYGKVGWVTNYGEFGQENAVIVLEPNLLTRRQWRIVDEMHETDRYGYIQSILIGNTAVTEQYEEEYS